MYSFHFQSTKWRRNINRTVHELSILYESTIQKIVKRLFRSIKIELRDTFVSVGITRVVLLFRKISDNRFLYFILQTKRLLKVQLVFLFFVDMQDSVEEFVVLLLKPFREFPSLQNIYYQLQKKLEQNHFKSQLQRLEKMSMDEKNSKLLQKMLEQKQLKISWEVENRNPSVELVDFFLEKVDRKSVVFGRTKNQSY